MRARPSPLSRRAFLAGAAALGASGWLGAPRAHAFPDLGQVRRRADWSGDLAPTGPLEIETRADVRFLLVHHSASTNDYEPRDVPGILRSFYAHHTGGNGWPDIAYNFLVDRFGTVWEGRAGSIGRPVRGDATGGSQGFALLACFVGDHTGDAPTPAAFEAMAGLLAGLAQRYGVEPRPGAVTRFVSRGSNRHPPGTVVTTATIAGHRDMSRTACPGDAAYALVGEALPARVAALASRPRRHAPPIFPDRL